MDDILQFHTASAALCQAAWALHGADEQQHRVVRHNLADSSLNLRHTIQSLLDTTAVITGLTAAFDHACRKVGRGLAIRLDRAESLIHDPRGAAVQGYELGTVWAQDVVQALATRPIALMRQYRDVYLGSNALLDDERALLRIRLDTSRTNQIKTNKGRRNREPRLSTLQYPPITGSSLPKSMAIDVSVLASRKPSQPGFAPADLLNEFILDTLAFKGMSDREDTVSKAH